MEQEKSSNHKCSSGEEASHAKVAVTLAPWRMPQPFCSLSETFQRAHPLMVYNSLTRSKVRFIPRLSLNNPMDKTVVWYQCGPTVYADSHLGHARTYVTLDIIRRIMEGVAGYKVLLCQNVTDIDDKIILRSSEMKVSFLEFARKYENEFNEDIYGLLGCMPPDITTRVTEYVKEIIAFIETLIQRGVAYESNGSVYFSVAEFEKQGHKYAKLQPEQVGNSQVLAEGEGALCGAESEKKDAADFVLWKRTKEQAMYTPKATESCPEPKPFLVVEPFWESPWGKGRPGWHIECSAMVHAALSFTNDADPGPSPDAAEIRSSGHGVGAGGKKTAPSHRTLPPGVVDVHAGGEDLKFPHHDNEIAQSEGFTGQGQWVNYWLHTGHLNIKGLKMSKSLKNFVTIRSALETHSSRQIRLLFLMHKYSAKMDYSDGTMTQAESTDRLFSEFFLNIKAALHRIHHCGESRSLGAEERHLRGRLQHTDAAVRAALLDDFDTPLALTLLGGLLKDCNKYLDRERGEGVASLCGATLESVAQYVTSMMRVFGLTADSSKGGKEIGFGGDNSVCFGGAEASKEQLLGPLLDVLTRFRTSVRLAAMKGEMQSILALGDGVRDNELPELGVRVEDQGGQEVWKLVDPAELKKEKAQKLAAKEAKEKQKAEAAAKQAEREAKARVPPQEMFIKLTDQYSKFDEQGIPTHDKAGEPLPKNALKKLQKEWEKQKEAYEKLIAKAAASPPDASSIKS